VPISEIERRHAYATLREYCEERTKPEMLHEIAIDVYGDDPGVARIPSGPPRAWAFP
jgi:hypothetical protein